MMGENLLLDIRNLTTHFYTYEGTVRALDGVYVGIRKGDSLGIVGETGCGKSVTALSVMRLIQPPGRIIDGEVKFEGEDLLKKTEEEIRNIRGKKIAMIFQEPKLALHPLFTVGNQVADVIRLHYKAGKNEALARVLEMFKLVKLPDPEEKLHAYPHLLSGGMLQRVLIAMALSCHAPLLIADEPTTALDVNTEAQILQLIKELQREFQMSILLITHNLAVVAQTCNRLAVMYAGTIVEQGRVDEVFKNPGHPYTVGLLGAFPKTCAPEERLTCISGSVPNLINPPLGCRFHPRCPDAVDICRKKKPEPIKVTSTHTVSCHKM